MKPKLKSFFKNWTIISCLFLTILCAISQTPIASTQKSDFWQRVQFGGGLGLTFGEFTNISIAPQAIYNVNQFVSVGAGVQYNYLKNRDIFKASMFGGSVIGLFNPIPSVQLSAEIEQLRVDRTTLFTTPNIKDQFWNTAAFVGAGYRIGNVSIGGRYNLLFNKDRNIYGSAFMPFVRAFF